MADVNILKEFLIRLGFKTDETQLRNFTEAIRKTSSGAADMARGFAKVGEASALAMSGMGAGLDAIAKPLSGLYLAAQRTGASVKELQTFSFAAEQVGVSAERLQGTIEALAAARRVNPGLNALLPNPNETDNAKALLELLVKLRNLPHFEAVQVGSLFGIDEITLNQLESNGPAFLAALKKREKMFASSGIDPDEFAAKGRVFVNQMRVLETHLVDLSETVAVRLMPYAEKMIGWLDRAAEYMTKLDSSTNGWSSRLIGLAVGVKALTTSLSLLMRFSGLSSLFGGIGKVAGIGRGAAVAGEAAEVAGGAAVAGEGAAAGGGALAALPLIIIAAVGAALTWMTAHPEQVRKAVEAAAGWAKKEVVKGLDAAKKEAHALPGQLGSLIHSVGAAAQSLNQQVKAAGGYAKTIQLQAGLVGGSGVGDALAAMVSKFEGHVKDGFGLYKDIAGKLTVGYGHLVRAGEDFSKGLDQKGATALLAKDLASAVASVSKLVKVHLDKNQQNALADFVFNLGGDKFAHSTLLKKLNAGDFAGAADQFQHWNKVMQNGHLVANEGLSKRREAEANLFRSGGAPVQITQKTDIHVEGGDAKNTAQEVARHQSRVNGDMVRNFAGATQ